MALVKGGFTEPTLGSSNGSDLSGSNGATNRTLNLGGVSKREIVFVQGRFLHPIQEYTKATVGGVSQITFLGKVYDQHYIEIYYWT